MGGIAQIDGDRLRLIVGRLKVRPRLPGDEPITDWFTGAIDRPTAAGPGPT